MRRPVYGLWITTLLWIAVAGGMWAVHDYQLRNGEEVELKTVPIDPRDLLRGDYVILRYEISTIEVDQQVVDQLYRRPRQVVYISLRDRGGVWEVGEVSPEAPESGLFLRGRVRSESRLESAWRLEVEYGIESFFVPEGEGLEYEEARNRDRLWAVVSVSPHGVARLKRLEIR